MPDESKSVKYTCKYCGSNYDNEKARDQCEAAFGRLKDCHPLPLNWYEASYQDGIPQFVFAQTIEWNPAAHCLGQYADVWDGEQIHMADHFYGEAIDIKTFYEKHKRLPPFLELAASLSDATLDWFTDLLYYHRDRKKPGA